jgi:hypothetical protein
MINRRQFIGMTFALAAASAVLLAVAAAPPVPLEGAANIPIPETQIRTWWPTEAEVAGWLEWYKAWIGNHHTIEKLADCFPMELVTFEDGSQSALMYQSQPVVFMSEQNTVKTLEDFERALCTLDHTRHEVGYHQGLGYEAGRRGESRECRTYQAPSNHGFAWYNGWAQGNLDYRWKRGEVKLERSPGVYFPPGDKRRWNRNA